MKHQFSGKRRRGKRWALIDPTGMHHQFENLSRFVSDHPELFKPDDVELIGATSTTRASMILARLRPSSKSALASWRGWRWDDQESAIAHCDVSKPKDSPALRTKGKTYSLRSPDGATFHFVNLTAFLREHAAMFDEDDLRPYVSKSGKVSACRAAIGLGALRPGGKSKHRSWKDWTWEGG